ncbi:small nuclear ribonucleoprotein Sm D1 [Gregarina niphandrodes]|uniref:Small nuclear ribonucleoprotein Sm D1 n=1 Tax=Gregarina niphandrodes TaxID=110365 RepID=A0A023B639_GRENI|nr:small nuclear ribonucleoprotein Sm D1 [Gregarina niphandrodes]EZG65036.1 small nuclear ribonucleoprotein Sm D1 [Gregarina niphandrodes]|eukprot:XP_011134112.1 small nuclear ribonucleoprotein Sm D1 [Gregarina niphandrodes]
MKLVRFLMRLANESVVVELKNGTMIQGTIVGVDVAMNMHLKNAKMTVKARNPINVDNITIRGATIRLVLISDSIPLDTYLIDDGTSKVKTAETNTKRKSRTR